MIVFEHDMELYEVGSKDLEKPFLSIVIPTYNESENIEELLRRIQSSLSSDLEDSYEIVIVDDNSPDKTWAKALTLMRNMGLRGRVIVRRYKKGLGTAIVTGIRFSEGKYIAVMDADLQHPPEELSRMLEKALKQDYDLVIASRYVRGGGIEGWSTHRKIISLVASYIARILIPHVRRIRDPMSGFFLFRRDSVDPERLVGDGMKVLLEIIVKGDVKRIYEHPYVFKRRGRGRSKLSFRDVIDFLAQVLRLSEYRILKFIVVGSSGVIVNTGVLYVMVENGFSRPIASLVAIEISTVSNFILNDLWTFSRDRRGSWMKRLLGYHMAVAVGNIVIFTVFNILSLFIYYIIANLVGIILGFITNYIISSELVWGLRRYSRGA
ncbi:MAG: glycosyltransferase family 2 protein [Sulfolobales archaeon]